MLEEFDFVLRASLLVVGGYGTTPTTPKFYVSIFFSNQPFVGVEVGNAYFDIIFENVALPLPPTSWSANHGFFMDLHPSVGETTSQAIVFVGNHVELNELKKKT